MHKLKLETPNIVEKNIELIGQIFPSCMTEIKGSDGKIKRGINFEALKQMLSPSVIDGDESYGFTWVGKKSLGSRGQQTYPENSKATSRRKCQLGYH